MADAPALIDVGKLALSAAGGGGVVLLVTQILGGLAKGWVSGTAGQEKEIREDMRIELQRLSADLSKARDEIDEMRQDFRRLTEQYLRVFSGRENARATLNAFETARGLPLTAWPPDPPAPGGTP
ncbi:hypothetical protein [Deinococcus altitudinis]|uniref:hypothetical protein n=1 Tax=Deinococcus altitudinis TaxID=468914 RepID=UPI0038915B70